MAHWIIEDEGFGGCYYRCSNCGEVYNDIYDDVYKWTHCMKCFKPINDDENEYVEHRNPITNFDYIKSMNMKELSEFLMKNWFVDGVCNKCEGSYEKCGIEEYCTSQIFKWLSHEKI